MHLFMPDILRDTIEHPFDEPLSATDIRPVKVQAEKSKGVGVSQCQTRRRLSWGWGWCWCGCWGSRDKGRSDFKTNIDRCEARSWFGSDRIVECRMRNGEWTRGNGECRCGTSIWQILQILCLSIYLSVCSWKTPNWPGCCCVAVALHASLKALKSLQLQKAKDSETRRLGWGPQTEKMEKTDG